MINNNGVKERKNGINGLDIGSIMGVNKNKSAKDVYFDKVNFSEKIKKEMELQMSSEANYWDSTFKEIIAQEFSLRSNKKVRKENKQLVDIKYEYIVGDVDRKVVGENSILMCKSENAFIIKDWNGGNLPAIYILEAQHCMRISKAEKCYIAALIGNRKFVYKEIVRDEKIINMIIEIEKNFWIKNVLNKIPPK
jgi:putative phage-type endonuclease